MMRLRFTIVSASACFGVWLVALPGCRERGKTPAGGKCPACQVVQTVENGPVSMTIRISEREITLAERFRLAVEVTAASGIEVEMPKLEGHLGDLAIRDSRKPPVDRSRGRLRLRHEYCLDAFCTGSYIVPRLTAKFADRRTGHGSAAEAEVTTDEFVLIVKPAVEGELDPDALRGIKGPVPLPADRAGRWAWWTSAGLVSAAVLVTAVIWVRRRCRRGALEKVVLPAEWAFEQLRALNDEQLVERGLVQEFYFRLSMIVRRYIKRQFDLMAPERATEEFMAEVRGSVRLPHEYRGTLDSFLKACDLVKFARHVPQVEETNQVLTAAFEFVGRSGEIERRQVVAE